MARFIWINITNETGELLDRFQVMRADELPLDADDIEIASGAGRHELTERIARNLEVNRKAVR